MKHKIPRDKLLRNFSFVLWGIGFFVSLVYVSLSYVETKRDIASKLENTSTLITEKFLSFTNLISNDLIRLVQEKSKENFPDQENFEIISKSGALTDFFCGEKLIFDVPKLSPQTALLNIPISLSLFALKDKKERGKATLMIPQSKFERSLLSKISPSLRAIVLDSRFGIVAQTKNALVHRKSIKYQHLKAGLNSGGKSLKESLDGLGFNFFESKKIPETPYFIIVGSDRSFLGILKKGVDFSFFAGMFLAVFLSWIGGCFFYYRNTKQFEKSQSLMKNYLEKTAVEAMVESLNLLPNDFTKRNYDAKEEKICANKTIEDCLLIVNAS